MPVTAVSARIDAVEEIHAAVHRLQDIRRRADSHQIDWPVLRKLRHHMIQNIIHLLMCFTDRQSTDRVAVKIQLRDLFACSIRISG